MNRYTALSLMVVVSLSGTAQAVSSYSTIDQQYLQYIQANPWSKNNNNTTTTNNTTNNSTTYTSPTQNNDEQQGTKIDPWSDRPTKRPMSDQQIAEVLVKGSIANYTGECPCPYSTDKNGKKCGDTSEYVVSPGELLCYPDDVSQRQIFEYRAKNRIPNPNQPWMIYR